MSIKFSDTTNKNGLVQFFEREIGANPGDVSGNATRLQAFTADVNVAMDDFVALAIRSSGTWQFDDSNQSDYPIITTDLKAGQRDYTFTTDGSGNLILEIYRVFIKNQAGVYQEVYPIDAQSDANTQSLTDGRETQGTPYRYDKTANGFFVDPVPSYDSTAGVKAYINREATYFASIDTTKKPGVPGIFHKYFYLKAAYAYAARKGMEIAGGRLRNGAFTGLLMQVNDLESQIADYFGERERDVRHRLTTKPVGFR